MDKVSSTFSFKLDTYLVSFTFLAYSLTVHTTDTKSHFSILSSFLNRKVHRIYFPVISYARRAPTSSSSFTPFLFFRRYFVSFFSSIVYPHLLQKLPKCIHILFYFFSLFCCLNTHNAISQGIVYKAAHIRNSPKNNILCHTSRPHGLLTSNVFFR